MSGRQTQRLPRSALRKGESAEKTCGACAPRTAEAAVSTCCLSLDADWEFLLQFNLLLLLNSLKLKGSHELRTGVSPQCKKDSPEPPRLSSKPSRLEGQLDDFTVPGGCCNRVAD